MHVVGARRSAQRSTSRFVLHREHSISSQGKPPLIAASMVGDGSIGPPSIHIFSFQLWQARLFPYQGFADAPLLLRLLGKDLRHGAILHELLFQRLAVAA
jgi:hypothetical protein